MYPEQTEHQIQSAILEYLPYLGVFAWRNNSGMLALNDKYGKKRMVKMGMAGLPDILGVQRGTGRLIAIEVKRPGRKPTDIQQRMLQELTDHGALAFVATSIEDVQQHLSQKP